MSRGTRLAGVAVVALLAACTPEASEGPTPVPETPTMTSQSPSPTPSPTPSPSPNPTEVQSFPPPPADETEEEAAIREGWMNYWRTFDRYIKNGSLLDLSEARLVTVPGSSESTQILDIIAAYRERGVVAVGDRQFRDLKISDSTNQEGVRTAVVSYCHDSKLLALVDVQTGEPSDIPSIATMREQAMLEQGADSVWRVASIKNEVATC